MAALMLPVPTMAVTEEKQKQKQKRTLVRNEAVPRKKEDHKLFKKIWIHASRHILINNTPKRRQDYL